MQCAAIRRVAILLPRYDLIVRTQAHGIVGICQRMDVHLFGVLNGEGFQD